VAALLAHLDFEIDHQITPNKNAARFPERLTIKSANYLAYFAELNADDRAVER
jgi:hypothetical protein